MKQGNGFTLIELLVVMAIISILASILFPVFSSAREKGRQTVCMSNLRQIGMSVAMKVMDEDGVFPPPDQVFGKGGIYVCPSDPYSDELQLSYEMNGLLIGASESDVEEPSRTVLILDAGVDDGIFTIGDETEDTVIPALSSDYPASNIPNPMNAVHLKRANVVYVDGHAKSVREGQLTISMFILN